MTRSFCLLLMAIFVGACSSPNRESNATVEQESQEVIPAPSSAQLMEEVMALHDAVMPEMGNIRSTEKALRQLAESTTDAAKIDIYRQQADAMDSAFNAMMVWMRQFEPEFEGTEDEVKTYLEEQRVKMSDVKDLMEAALENGRKLVEGAQ